MTRGSVSVHNLTPREAEVCDVLLETGSNQAIAIRLRVTEETVYQALLRARRKLKAANTVLLALTWAEFRRRQREEAKSE